ncbi:hypothetical protein B0H14DRAFT_3530943 [Mycena olivaceomarginata]|nr:hypothetical protein B0H14DRAFT_3530943 [Mycena olivaceomarginata]
MSLHPMQAFNRWQEREQDHGNAAAVIRCLDNLYGVKSPTPETETVHEQFAREEREDTELELGIQLSLAHPQLTLQQAGPLQLHLPSPIQQAGRLRSLSASPELLAALFPTLSSFSSLSPPQPFPTPALSRAQAPNVTAKEAATPPVPRKRRPAASMQKSTAPLRITTQLNKDWMAAKGGPIPQATATHATFHTARTTNRFTVVFVDEAPKLQTAICIDTCPQWPDYVFDNPTLARLGIDTAAMELYSTVQGAFISITKEYFHSVATNSVTLLRQPGVQRSDLDHIISTFFPSTKSLHLRYNVSGKRAAVRAAYKEQDATPIVVVDDNSDSEVEVTSGKRLIKREPGVSPPWRRPCLSINTTLSRSSAPGSSTTPTPSLSSTHPTSLM